MMAEVWWPNEVAKQLPSPLLFEDIWVVGLQGVVEGKYSYGVTQLVLNEDGNVPVSIADIDQDFNGWNLRRIQ